MTARRARRRRPALKWIIVAVAAVAAFYLSRTLFHRSRKPEYPATAFFEVQRGDMLISITEDGALRAVTETTVRSSLDGLNRIIHLVPEGVNVKKGDLLVELDSSGLKDRLNEQELIYQDRLFQLSQAEANLVIQKITAESQIKDAELKIENAESDLEKYRDGEAPLLLKTVEVRSGVLAEQVRIARERFARTEVLFKIGNATRSEVEADALSLKREQLALSQYEEDLRLIKKFDQPNQIRLLESKVTQAKADLQRLKQRTSNELAQAAADLKTSQRTIGLMEESIKTQKERLENAKIFAPQDGLVVYAPISPFQTIGGGEMRRDEGRFRGSRSGRGENGEFRGGRRGGRSDTGSGDPPSPSSGSSSSSTAQSVSAANQRIASAISGSDADATSGSGAGNSSFAGGSRGGGYADGASQGASSASSAFVSYPSMRPSSSIKSSAANTTASGGSAAGVAGPASSLSAQAVSQNVTPQFGFRSDSMNRGGYQTYEVYGTPGILQEGTMVRQRQELIRLPDVSKMVAEIRVHESRVRQVRPGMTAYVRVETIPDRYFKGTVRHIALLPDAQMSWMNADLKVFPTDVLVDEQLPDLKPGVSARAEIIITNLTKVLSVPIQTVARLDGENVCFVKKGSSVAPVPVTTGWFNDRYVEITSGLKEGDLVLLAAVGDETMDADEDASTNAVDSAAAGNPRPMPPPGQENPEEGRRIQRRNSDSPDGAAPPPEGRRNREGRARNPREGAE